MENEKFQMSERDLLVQLMERVDFLTAKVNDLSCQTMAKLSDHDRRIEINEKCIDNLKEMLKGKQDLLKVIIGIGTVAIIALIYHITGYKI